MTTNARALLAAVLAGSMAVVALAACRRSEANGPAGPGIPSKAAGNPADDGRADAAASPGGNEGGAHDGEAHDGGVDATHAGADASDRAPRAAWSASKSGTTRGLSGVWGSGPSDVWAVGDKGTVVHWSGAAWSASNSGTSVALHGVWGSGPSDVWVVGDKGTVVHWNGTAWSASSSGTSAVLNAVAGSSAGDVWAVGGEGKATTITHWNGRAWSVSSTGLTYTPPLPGAGRGGETTMQLSGVWASGPSDAWVAANGSQMQAGPVIVGALLHWNGRTWSGSDDWLGVAHSVWGSGPDDVSAVGSDRLHWDGKTWADRPSEPDTRNDRVGGVWGSGPNDVWAAAGRWGDDGGWMLHWNGQAWSDARVGTKPLSGAWGSGPNDVWAVGAAGTILHHP